MARIPFELELALLYLFSRRGRGHRSRLVRVTAVGLAFGAFALVVTLSLLGGFQEAIRGEMRATAPGVAVRPASGGRLDDAAGLAAIATALPGVAEARPRRVGDGWASRDGGGAGVRILEDPEVAEGEAILDAAASAGLGVLPGEEIVVVSPREEATPFGPVPRGRRLRVAGFRPAGPRESGRVFVSPRDAGDLLGTGGAHELLVTPDEATDPADLASRLAEAVRGRGVRVEPSDDTQKALSAALELERRVLFAALALVVAVAAAGVTSDLSLMAVERRGGAAILRAQGATPGFVLRLYLWVGFLAGAAGGIVGGALGAAAAWILDRTALLPLPEGLYTLDRLPFRVRAAEVGLAVLVTTLLATLAAVWPSRRAAAEDPAVAIRER